MSYFCKLEHNIRSLLDPSSLGNLVIWSFLVGLILASLSSGIIVHAEETITNPASYTIWQEGKYYYARDSYGNTVGPSTNASSIIQGALNALTSGRTWKEKLVLRGVFIISSPLSVPSYTIFDASAAELRADDYLNAPIITNSNLTGGNRDIELYVGVLNGNEDNQNDTWPYPYGVHLGAENPNEVYNVIIQGYFADTLRETLFLDRVANAYLDVLCTSSRNYEGIVIRASHGVQGRITAWDNAEANVYLDYSWDCQITATTSKGKYGVGLYASTHNKIKAITKLAAIDGIFVAGGSDWNEISGTSYLNARDGIWVANSRNVEISGQYYDNGEHGVELYNVNRSKISVISYKNGRTTTGRHGIYGYNSLHITVAFSHSYDSQSPKTQDRPIASAGASDFWEVVNNDFVDGGLHPPDFVGSHNLIERNLGFVENSGAASREVSNGESTRADSNPWNLSLLVFFPFDSSQLLGFVPVILAFACFGAKGKRKGLTVSMIIAMILTYLGWAGSGMVDFVNRLVSSYDICASQEE